MKHIFGVSTAICVAIAAASYSVHPFLGFLLSLQAGAMLMDCYEADLTRRP